MSLTPPSGTTSRSSTSIPSGKIVSRVTSDTQDFSDVVSLVTNLISQVLLVVILSVWLFNINVGLTLLLIGFSPMAVIIALSFRRIARTVTQRARRVTAKINAQIQESVSGIMVAKSFRQERAIYATFDDNNRQAYAVGLRRGLTLNTIFPIMGIAPALGVAAPDLLLAGWRRARAWARSARAIGICSCRRSASFGGRCSTSRRSGASSRTACRPPSASLR